MENARNISFDDMPEITDFSKGRKNPFAEKIKKEGYSVTIHYSPEDVANGQIDDMKEVAQALVDLMSESEARQLVHHIKDNYNLPCSPDLWDVLN